MKLLTITLTIFSVTSFQYTLADLNDRYINAEEKVLDLCDNPIYCKGTLLKTVQLAHLYPDSKYFVDLRMKHDQNSTLENFRHLMEISYDMPNKTAIQKFVDEHFEDVNPLEPADLPDWTPTPSLLQKLKDPNYRKWASDLNEIWKDLARRISDDVKDNPDKHSLIYVNNTFVIPGGRFREFYYWDTYWVIEGLLLSDMHATTKGIIENFLSMVESYGFIPNGGRIYYLMRSQPPILIPMVQRYFEATNDWEFVENNLAILEKEFDYWQRYKTVTVLRDGKYYKLARYITHSQGPRPESYKEDYDLALGIDDLSLRQKFYASIKAGAESGWDFSARWFVDKNGSYTDDLFHIATENILPVDLNSFIERNARILSIFFARKNDEEKYKYYAEISEQYRKAISVLLWNEEDGTWYDYDIEHKKQRKIFYASNLTPLYTMSFDDEKADFFGEESVKYLRRMGVEDYAGSIPASLNRTSQQWDFPNAWAPLQSIIVQGLRQTGHAPAIKLAENLAMTWLKTTYLQFEETKKMYEKYDATELGKIGGGGEYEIQYGFGWTNGVVLEFLNYYPEAIHVAVNKTSLRNNAVSGRSRQSKMLKPVTKRPVLHSIWTHYRS